MRHITKSVVGVMYSCQKSASKVRGHAPPAYTKEELLAWVNKQPIKDKLWQDWIDSDFATDLKPSIDRLDDYKGYYFGNIRLCTWGENKAKGHADRKAGINNKHSKAVLQYDKNTGILIKEYHSVMEAARNINKSRSSICMCCNGQRKTAHGCIWRYKEDLSVI